MKIIYLLSCLLLSNLINSQNNNSLLVESKYAVDINSTWKKVELNEKKFYFFNDLQNISIGYNKNATVWCWFKIRNSDSLRIKKTWLCFDNNHIDSLVVVERNRTRILGDRTSYSSPFISALAFEFILKPNESKSFIVKIKKGISTLDFSYKFEAENELKKQSEKKIAIISFFLGFLFLLLLFNLILFYISNKKLYLYYILFSILSAIYVMISSNYAKHILFTDFLYFSEFRIYTASLWFISLNVFITHFLDLKIFQAFNYKLFKFLNCTNLLIIVLSIVLLVAHQLDSLKLFMIVGYFNFLILILLILWAVILHLKIERKTAIYVLIAFVPYLIWGAGIILKSFQIIPRNLKEDWLIFISLFEVFLFGFVLTKNYIDTFQKNKELIAAVTVEKENSIKAITQAQIRERRNISNVIHDNFGSKIAYISHLLQLKNIELADKNIKELAIETRNISHQILPISLDDGALIASIRNQITTLNSGLKHSKIELFDYDFPNKINEIWIYDLYLITLEIINNALKHGKAKTICVELFGYPDEYLLQFTDDGRGFDTNAIPKGFGLETIERRILLYKGVFEINSNVNHGTIIQISIPK